MDQTIPLSAAIPTTPPPAAPDPVAVTAGTADEDPESPGRSPGGSFAASSVSDPLGEGLSVLAGMAIALIAVLVPLITVVCETPAIEPVRSSSRSLR